MNHQLNPHLSKRVADYFAIVGAGDEFIYSDTHNLVLSAEVTDRYPLIDRHDVAFPDGIALFCFPDGIQVCNILKSPRFYSFVHTSERGAHILGCCLIFYEPMTEAEIVSARKQSEKYGLAEDELSLGQCFIPRCLCIISHYPFITSFKRVLCQIYRISLTPSAIPIERYICNFIDDVPAPPAGLVDITFYLGDSAITFQCPPANQPYAWLGVSISPLFECLQPENILLLLSVVLVERQIVFVSSQYSLLTSCADAITSLLYPLSWSHVYIPILPRCLLGVLSAPLPFILGIHKSFLQYPECLMASETVVVHLDENRIHFGSLGKPPPLPEKRAKKLLALIQNAAPVFALRPSDWSTTRLTEFDSAFEMSVRPDEADGSLSQGHTARLVDEAAIRTGFLRFFSSIFLNYRKYLVQGSADDPFPLVKFRVAAFLSEHPPDWTPLLGVLLKTQAFSQFVDERLPSPFPSGREPSRAVDIQFFDESINAKKNRSVMSQVVGLVDTPLLQDESGRHVKTYVPPTPNTASLPPRSAPYLYPFFPRLDAGLLSAPRNTEGLSALELGHSIAAAKLQRLRLDANEQHCGGRKHEVALDADACVFAAFLSVFGHLVTRLGTSAKGLFSSLELRPVSSRPSTRHILSTYSSSSVSPRPSVSEDIARLVSKAEITLNQIDTSPVSDFSGESQDRQEESVEDTDAAKSLHAKAANQDVEDGISSSQQSVSDTLSSASRSHRRLELPLARARSHSNDCRLPGGERMLTHAKHNSLLTAQLSGTSSLSFFEQCRDPKFRVKERDLLDESLTAARAGLETAFEVLAAISRVSRQKMADADIFRVLSSACGACGDHRRALELVDHMVHSGVVPDQVMLEAIARACCIHEGVAGENESDTDDPGVPKTARGVWVFYEDRLRKHRSSASLPKSAAASETRTWYSARAIHALSCQLFSSYAFGRATSSRTAADDSVHSVERKRSSSYFGGAAGDGSPRVGRSVTLDDVGGRVGGQQDDGPFGFSRSGREHSNSSRSKTRLCQWPFKRSLCVEGETPLASPALKMQVLLGEQTLSLVFPDLHIDLFSPFGTVCPSNRCKHALTQEETQRGWTSDPNRYTTSCPLCGREFVPRFTVHCSAADWVGSEGLGSALWSEFLSPWTLRKELDTVLFQDGLDALLSPSFRMSERGSAIFWNSIVHFRMLGLPLTFLLCQSNALAPTVAAALLVPLDREILS